MRRILRNIAMGEMNDMGDTSTLLNPEVVQEMELQYPAPYEGVIAFGAGMRRGYQ